jgi:AcrR family transcriptional regulator
MSFEPKNSPRETIVLALMQLANNHDWHSITLPMIAKEAGVSLDIMREHFPSKGAMLAGFAKIIDAKVLKGTTADMSDEPVRDRLLDIMLRRFDALAPFKAAIGNIKNHMKFDALNLFALNGVALNSWRYMLAAAGIDTEGHFGAMRVQGAALIFASSIDAWLHDTNATHDKTMAVLDSKLKKGEAAMERVAGAEKFLGPIFDKFSGIFKKRCKTSKSNEHDMAAEI